MSSASLWIPSVLYAAAGVAAFLDVHRARTGIRFAALLLAMCAMAARVAALLQPGTCPVTAGTSGMIVALFLCLHAIVGFRRDGSDRVRFWVELLLVFLFDTASTIAAPAPVEAAPAATERALGVIHGGLVLLSYASFFAGAVYGVLYLALYRLMKRRRLGFWFSRLPSLERLESRAANATVVGLAFLTAGLGLGVYSYAVFRGGIPYANAKFVVAFIVWALFAAEVLLRRRLGWRGIRVMWVPVAGAVVVLFLFSFSAGHPFWSPA